MSNNESGPFPLSGTRYMKEPRLFYIILGEDEQDRKEKVEELIASLIPAQEEKQAVQIYHANEINGAEVIERARTLPFFVSRQLFVIKNVHQLKKKGIELFTAYMENPASSSYFIFEGDPSGGRDKIPKSLMKKCQAIQIKKQTKKDLEKFVLQRVRKSGRKISQNAAELLLEKAGGSYSFLVQAIDRLVLNTDPHETFTEEMINGGIGAFLSYDSYDLTDAMSNKNCQRTLEIMGYLLEEGVVEVEIIGMLSWQIRRLFEAKKYLEAGASEKDLSAKFRVNPYYLPKFLQQMKNFKQKELIGIVEELYQIDRKIKIGLIEARKALEFLLIGICRGQFV